MKERLERHFEKKLSLFLHAKTTRKPLAPSSPLRENSRRRREGAMSENAIHRYTGILYKPFLMYYTKANESAGGVA